MIYEEKTNSKLTVPKWFRWSNGFNLSTSVFLYLVDFHEFKNPAQSVLIFLMENGLGYYRNLGSL